MWRGKNKACRWPYFLVSAVLLTGGARASEIQVELRNVDNQLISAIVSVINGKGMMTPYSFEKGTGTIICTDTESVVEADAGPRHYLLAGQNRHPCSGTSIVFTFQIARSSNPSSNKAPRIDRSRP